MIEALFFICGAAVGIAGVFAWIWLSGRKIVSSEDAYWGRTRD